MTAIYKREMGSYYNTMYGYAVGAALLLFEGIFIWMVNISGAYTQVHYTLSHLAMVLLLAVPVLTMRSFAEERRQKTDLLLYSLPLGSGQIVLGKFFAALSVLLIPMVLILIYPLLLGAYGSINYLTVYCCMLAFILLAAALIAIGLFLSSLVENQAVAAVLTFGVMLFLFFLDALAGYVSGTAAASLAAFIAASVIVGGVVWLVTRNLTFAGGLAVVLCAAAIAGYVILPDSYAGLFPQIVASLSLFGRFNAFLDGLVDVSSLVFMLSVTAVFLFLTVQSVEKRRWS